MSTPPAPCRTGVWLYPDAPAGALVDAVVALDAAGVDEVWIADEGVAREPMVVLAAAARATTRVRLGVGITSPALRHAGALASAASTLDELADGRVVLGFGVGGEESLAPFGLTVDKPVTLVRDALRTARAVLGRQRGDGYDPPVHAAPPRRVPLFVGAKGEQLNRLASREADGVFLSGFALDALDAPVAWARSVHSIDVALYASVRFDADAPHDPTALRGSPEQVAEGMAALVARHAPAAIGLALIDGPTPLAHLGEAMDAIGRFRRHAQY